MRSSITNQNGKVLKKVLIGLGAFFGLLVVAAAVIPFFVDVDAYRPKIVEVADEQLNGKLELGKLSLSLWGQVRINVDGFSLSDAKGRKVVAAKEVFFHLPFFSLLTGSPVLTFKMVNPEVSVVKDKAGKINALTLMKPAPKTEAKGQTPPPATTQAAAPSKPMELPSIATRARLGLEMKNAQLSYHDEQTGMVSRIEDLNVVGKNLSLSQPMELLVTASLDTRMGKTLSVKGPMKFTAKMSPHFNGGIFESSDLALNADLDGIQIVMPGLFEKKAGMATNADGNLTVTPESATIKNFTCKFFNAEATTSGKVEGFSDAAGPKLDLHVKSNPVLLKPWNELVPMLKEYDLGGTASFDADLGGTASQPKYKATAQVKGLTAKAPHLKAEPQIDAFIKVVTDAVEDMGMTLKAPGNELNVRGKVVSFTKPRVDIVVKSTGMDLDQLIDFPKAEAAKSGSTAKTEAAPANGAASEPAAGAKAAENLDASVDPLRENAVAKDTVANIKVQMAFLKAYQVKMSDITALMSFKNLQFALESFHVGVFGGDVKGSFSTALMPKTPTYKMGLDVAKLDLQKAVESQMQLFKNTLIGIASFKMEGSGASFNPDPAKKNLNAKGSFKVENAKFATIDVGKMVSDGINKSVDGLGSKVPALKGKSIGAPGNIDSKYQVVSSDFTISGGRFSAPNFVAKAETNKGLDMKGSTEVGLLDYGLNASWEVIDTYNLTKAKDLSVDQGGVHIEHILADNDGAVHIPIKVGGTCFAPQFNYNAVGESLGKVALNNATKAMTGKAKAAAQQQLQQLVQKQAPPQVQQQLKKLKLFGN